MTVNPTTAVLLLGLLILAGFATGRLLRRSPWRGRDRRREEVEDALKHLDHAERSGTTIDIDGLAGHLGISGAQAADVLARLGQTGLVGLEAGRYRLTDEGRRRARSLLRAHRLWERWLADRTGVEPAEWHRKADQMEHLLSPQETESLASRLGHPPVDPHGDPIPTPTGELPPRSGVPLTSVDPGRAADVVHLEDEPPELYRSLTGKGLALGSRIEVLSRTPSAITVRVNGDGLTLNLPEAGNVTVELLPPGTHAAPAHESLADARIGEPARVVGISSACLGPQRRRLLDLGLVPGTEVVPELSSASGDPVAYRIRGALIALREGQARQIQIERIREN